MFAKLSRGQRRMVVATLFILLGAVVVVCTGCASTALVTPPHASRILTSETTAADGTVTKTTTVTKISGPGYKGKNAAEVDSGGVSIGKKGAKAGPLSFDGPEEETSFSPLYILSGLGIIAAGVLWWATSRWKLAAAVGGTSILVMGLAVVADEYPWLYAVVGLAALGCVVYVLYILWRGERAGRALRAIVPAVAGLDPAVNEELTDTIKTNAGPRESAASRSVRDEVTAVKRETHIE